MMRTWSIAGFIDRVFDAAHTVERVTRPVRREHDCSQCDHDCTIDDACDCHKCPDGADELAEREAEIDAHEPNEIDVRLVGFTSCGQDMESYARGFNEGFDEGQRQLDPDWTPDDDTPNPTEPGLLDEELVAVRELIAPDARPAWAGKHYTHDTADRLCVYVNNGPVTLSDARCCICRPVRDIVEQMIEERFPQVSPAVSADARVSAAESGSTPPSPSAACTDPPSLHRADSVDGEGSLADSGIRKPPARERPNLADWLEPAAQTILDAHEYKFGHDTNCACGASGIFDWRDWQDHVAPIMSAHIAKDLELDWLPRWYIKTGPMGEPVPVELRPDMGIDSAADRRVTQHRNHLK